MQSIGQMFYLYHVLLFFGLFYDQLIQFSCYFIISLLTCKLILSKGLYLRDKEKKGILVNIFAVASDKNSHSQHEDKNKEITQVFIRHSARHVSF